MREAYTGLRMTRTRIEEAPEQKKNGLETSHLSFKISLTRSLTLFCRYFPVEPELGWTDAGFFPTKNKLQILKKAVVW